MIQALKELLERSPFQPFQIVTSSGDKYAISNPHLVAVGKGVIFIFKPDDHFAFVRNNQITSFESAQRAA